eukprot:CCRYP_008004-RA/>CCRYP_008004-RA protein AED:0.32 eAED:0.41 QI:336/0/0.5/1/0/0/2/0/86
MLFLWNLCHVYEFGIFCGLRQRRPFPLYSINHHLWRSSVPLNQLAVDGSLRQIILDKSRIMGKTSKDDNAKQATRTNIPRVRDAAV